MSDSLPSFAVGLPLTRAAIPYADAIHRGRRRASDEAAFILHPLEVAGLLQACGASDAVVAAGVLHDVVEQDGRLLPEIGRRFGDGVRALVDALSENPAIEPYGDRKAALRAQVAGAGDEALAIFAADKVSKVRELRTRIAASRAAGTAEADDIAPKLGHYRASLGMLAVQLPDHPLVGQLRAELDGLGSPRYG